MQEGHVLGTAPVAAVENIAAAQVQRPGDGFAVPLRQHENNPVPQSLVQQEKKLGCEIGPAPFAVHGGGVEAVEHAPNLGRERLARERLEGRPGLGVAPLALYRFALARGECGQKIVEGAKTPVLPVELRAQPLQPALLGQGVPFLARAEGGVDRGTAQLLRHGFQCPGHGRHGARVAREDARPRHRGERHRHLELGIVAPASAFQRVGPGVVEHIFAVGVGLGVAGGHRHHLARGVMQHGVARMPAGARAHRAAILQRREEGVGDERIIRPGTAIPCRLPDFGNPGIYTQRQRCFIRHAPPYARERDFRQYREDFSMADTTPSTRTPVYLADYMPPAFRVEQVELNFDLHPQATQVRARLRLHRRAAGELHLNGRKLKLHEILLDGEKLGDNLYTVDEDGLTVHEVPDDFTLETLVEICPAENTELSGLYMSGSGFFTQCEPEGFRKITYFPDRPDVMARYRVRMSADAKKFPVLLSNGNKLAEGEENGSRWAEWEDPHPKPSYLFALVAADLVALKDELTTMSGRHVDLGIWVERGDETRCGHAMEALKNAMEWDEETFGLEYDLDVFNIAAVSDFNAGAMENKGLNIFNTAYVLASPETATDTDFQNVERVIAHEYFHNWTGDRVTCRDWFQLSLKEGLTVFRDQEYMADQFSAAVKRIADVRMLRATQFRDDAGPLAHPVRPASYLEINNFYTTTIYEKGAEVVRMYRTLMGREAFRRGMENYIRENDNYAATVEDFLAAMQEAVPERDIWQILRWYEQAGTPEVTAEEVYDPDQPQLHAHAAPAHQAHAGAGQETALPDAGRHRAAGCRRPGAANGNGDLP